MGIPRLELFEWHRGPRLASELVLHRALLPSDEAICFGPAEAILAAEQYRSVGRTKSREVDLAVAECAIAFDAELWTENHRDFVDIPGSGIHTPL